MLKKPEKTGNAGKKFASLSDYIQDRVDRAGTFTSTKMWLKPHEIAEAGELLNTGGFTFKEIQRDEKGGVQLEVSW